MTARRRRIVFGAIALALIAGGALFWRAVPATWHRWRCERALADERPVDACFHYARFAQWRDADEEELLGRVALAIALIETEPSPLIRLARDLDEPPATLLDRIDTIASTAGADWDDAAAVLAGLGSIEHRRRLHETFATDAGAKQLLVAEALARYASPAPVALDWARRVARKPKPSPFAQSMAIEVLGLIGDHPDDVALIGKQIWWGPDGRHAMYSLLRLARREPTREAAVVALLHLLDWRELRIRAAGLLMSAGAMTLDDFMGVLARHRADCVGLRPPELPFLGSLRWWVAVTLDGRGEPEALDRLLQEHIDDPEPLLPGQLDGADLDRFPYYQLVDFYVVSSPDRRGHPLMRALARKRVAAYTEGLRGNAAMFLPMLADSGEPEDLRLLWPILESAGADDEHGPIALAARCALRILDRARSRGR